MNLAVAPSTSTTAVEEHPSFPGMPVPASLTARGAHRKPAADRGPVVRRLWLGYLGLGAIAVVGYYAVPSTGGHWPVVRLAAVCGTSASAAIAVFIGLGYYQPKPRAPWVFIGLSQLIFAVGSAHFYGAQYVEGFSAFRHYSDLFYLAHYPVLAAGLLAIVRRRAPGGDLPGILDGLLVATAAATLSYLHLIEPHLDEGGSLRPALASVTYPIADLVLLTIVSRMLIGRRSCPVAFALLATSLFALLAADTGYAIRRLGAGYNAGGLLDGIWMAESLVLGAAALHPTMAGITDPVAQQSSDLGRIRLAALYLVGIVAPVTLAARAGDADSPTELVTALAMVISMALIMIRMRCSESRQRRLANTDVITGLYTRRYLDRGLALAATAPVRPGATVSLLLVDIDHFKAINDQHGHPAGDRALAEIARRLRLAAGSDALVARYGGEEFAVLGRLLGPDDLRAAGERLRTSVAASPVFVTDDLPLQITVSVGAALAVPPTSPAELVCHADQALYAAKAQGRNRVVLADSLADGPAGATTGARRERADGVAALAGMTND